MIPPTPTLMPPGTAIFDIPHGYSLWASTDLAITTWNWIGDGRAIIQGLAIIMLVMAGMFIVWRFIAQMTKNDAED